MKQQLTQNQKEIISKSIKPIDGVLSSVLKCKICEREIEWVEFLGDNYSYNKEDLDNKIKANVYIPWNQSITSVPPYKTAVGKVHVKCPYCHYKNEGQVEILIKEN